MLAMFGQSALPTQNSSYYLSGIIPPPHILNLRFFLSLLKSNSGRRKWWMDQGRFFQGWIMACFEMTSGGFLWRQGVVVHESAFDCQMGMVDSLDHRVGRLPDNAVQMLRPGVCLWYAQQYLLSSVSQNQNQFFSLVLRFFGIRHGSSVAGVFSA